MKMFTLFMLFFVSFSLTASTPVKKSGTLLIKNVNIVEVKSGKLLKSRQVLIDGDKISGISRTGTVFSAEKIIDGTGKFLIPGLWDMHTHNWWDKHFSEYYIANGVLGVRNMYTPMQFITPLKDSINKGLIYGPHYYAAGRVVEGANPEFPDWLVLQNKEDIPAILDTLQMEGSDFVKVYNKIPRDLYFELVREAKKRNMRVEGHLPMSVSAVEASEAGQRSFEHLLGIPDLCTSDTLFSEFKSKNMFNWFAAIMKGDDYGTLKVNESLAAKNFSVLKKNKTYVCPTLTVWYNYLHPDFKFEEDGISAKFPDEMKNFWAGATDKFRKKDSAYKDMMKKKYENIKKATYLLYKNGVPLIAGTDVMNPYVYPGFSLSNELKLLKDCGIPDKEVLKMATINAAEFMNADNKFGMVKEGLEASLVLLGADPLKDISAVEKIEAVILNGKVLEKSVLEKMKK